MLDGQRHHAVALNYCQALSIAEQGGSLVVRVRDVATPGAAEETEIKARVVVNATGAWLEMASEALTGRRPGMIRTTKGVHLVCRALTGHALVLFSRVDRRLLFAIPRAGLTWIGTTDTDFTGDPALARADAADVHYLLQSVQHVFPTLRRDDVFHTTAGVRALVRAGGSESSVSRMHRVVSGPPAGPQGVISVLGGKITGYRAIAEEATDAVCERLGAANRPCSTAERPLPGGEPAGGEHQGAAVAALSPLADLYGGRLADLIALTSADPQLGAPLSPRYQDIGAQVVLAVREEHCVRLVGLHAPPHAARRHGGSRLGRRPACRRPDARGARMVRGARSAGAG